MIINSRYGPVEFILHENEEGEWYKVYEEPGDKTSFVHSDDLYYVTDLIKECERLSALVLTRVNKGEPNG